MCTGHRRHHTSYIEGRIQFTYCKDLSSLDLQETRLLRRRRVDTGALGKLHAPRKEAEAESSDMPRAVELFLEAEKAGNRFAVIRVLKLVLWYCEATVIGLTMGVQLFAFAHVVRATGEL